MRQRFLLVCGLLTLVGGGASDGFQNATFPTLATTGPPLPAQNRELLIGAYISLPEAADKTMNMMMNMKNRRMMKTRSNIFQPDSSSLPTNARRGSNSLSTKKRGRQGLCVIGCTPYVDTSRDDTGVSKYKALVIEMAKTCDVVIHVGDTKPSELACNKTNIVSSVRWMKAAAKKHGAIALYAPGDNELNDCHRSASAGDPYVQPADFYQASQVRKFLVNVLSVGRDETQKRRGRDLTMKYQVDTHFKFRNDVIVPGTNYTYSCDFDKYVELDHYAVATLEVPGSLWYLADETRSGYDLQDQVDPFMDRFGLYLNAMECAVDWIERSVQKASDSGKRAVFFTFHAVFYNNYGSDPIKNPNSGYFSRNDFQQYMRNIAGRSDVTDAYQPLFEKLTEVALAYPKLQFYVIHADGHRFQTLRLNPNLSNRGGKPIESNHNLRVHMVEGSSRALTMWTRFTVDPKAFQAVTLKEEWGRDAFQIEPRGHTWIPY